MSQRLDLARPFPQKAIKDNPSGYGSYVAHPFYKQRLLSVLEGYDFELVQVLRGDAPAKDKDADPLRNVVVGVVMRLTAVIDGRRTVIEEAGDCESPSNWPHDGARLKDAVTDALKRCCPHIGLGLHLYAGEDYALHAALKKAEEEEADTHEPKRPEVLTADPTLISSDDPGRPFDE